jgi:tRNA/tmRNA/rRNA uracil-C5-methylase (TrmA/RlmC/RlmD family)
MSVAAAEGVIELAVQSIAAGGDGVGRTEGLVVFVPRTAPGDIARVRIEPAKRFARGRLVSLIAASSARIDPPCKHYRVDACGGCQIQHIHYAAQLEAKQGIVRDAITRIAKRTAEIPSTRPSVREWRYRTKLTLAMKRNSDAWTMGLHSYDDPMGVFQLEDCPITDERVVASWREIMNAAALLPNANELRGTVRLAGEEIVVLIRGAVAWPSARAFFDAIPSASAVWWAAEDSSPRLLHERRHAPAGASFGQINAAVAEELRAHVIDRVRSHAPATVVDAYAGTGETATTLAALGARVTAIELDREAAALCATRLPPGSRSIVGRVETMLMKALPADVVVVNPPRVGLHERVTATLEREQRRPLAIVYVSCDPATLARDLTRLPSYRLASVATFDMFPQTAHVETVCELVPTAA